MQLGSRIPWCVRQSPTARSRLPALRWIRLACVMLTPALVYDFASAAYPERPVPDAYDPPLNSARPSARKSVNGAKS
jgi:hypothetical protein